MNDQQSGRKTQHQPTHDQTAPQAAARQEQTERKPSKIERREWRGSGVCGDRHTD